MRALVYHGRNDLRYEDFPAPSQLDPFEVRLRVKYAGICHTDFNELANGPIYIAEKPHPRTGRSVPIIPGHEFSGEVVEIGSSVRHLRKGECVAVNAVDACRNCRLCRQGKYALCPSAAYIGFSRDGGFSEFAVIPEDCCHCLGSEISLSVGALVEPLSVALHAVRQSRIRIGSRVAVVGGGTIGLCTLQALRATGARTVFIVEKSEAKRKLAEDLGAAVFINPVHDSPREIIEGLTEGLGTDVTFECVGSDAALNSAVEMTCPGGTICLVGAYPRPLRYDFNLLMSKEKIIVTSLAYGDEFPMVIAMLADGRLKAEPLITRTLSLAEALEGLSQYESFAATNIRTVIKVDG